MAIKSSLGVKVLILPLSLAMVVVILIIFAKPAFDSMKANRKALADSQKKLSDLQSQTRKLSELKEAFETFEEKKIIAAALPENESPEDYLNELYQRASRSGVLISSFTAATKKGSSGELAYICGADAASSGSTTGAASAGASAGLANPSASGSGAESAASACVQFSSIDISVEGNWEQLLNFYKYLADSNRVANVAQISISPQGQSTSEGSSSDLLNSTITLDVFYRSKIKTSSPEAVKILASGSGFNQGLIKKIKEVVYAPYEEPVVSETGERNFFK
ncbi:MAG: hypothetical protein UX02_C0001G0026 [Candidatus Moranbacteria bacterium GW2011_GWC1_45_18]|nr:MAG: hypothetical protein UT79_C0002G0371 [Candidatus Moranbacteria bacterium GW2011_GWC2_40_12]KKT34212.1 MAG: hypothetical protein UW19_C0001G0107 [Candidatus Moranbacteria bacterium GW2011_GWF2_44_10]KKU00578.1 MAG: hypothetical protein UX02_C0001G0026 [Candidatus Moranbacteria bacterium GW2011_GWC1_45_18]OGI36211.1 MAG: hypothetical protein A2407_03965 [Candidatus Moranbacteria bacterium RIFOXYC1_FULL_44_8]OGI39087.1 MAG: hypothetical protein A2374_04860 [Candidatus Moranbacteria bacteri